MKYESEKMPPAYILDKAVRKLNQYGMDVFEMFCDEANLSYCDRNRVISKCRLAYGRDDIFEMPIPENLKNERWRFYTRKLGYSKDKALKILKLIDDSYNNQQAFTGADIGKLTGGMLKEA
jgi:hypothetical protein